MVKIVENEVFALRHGEMTAIVEKQPTLGRWIAVMLRPVAFPDGEVQPVRHSDGKPVEKAAVIPCQLADGKWQWLQLSPATKESIGDLLFDGGAERDKWYYAQITSNEGSK